VFTKLPLFALLLCVPHYAFSIVALSRYTALHFAGGGGRLLLLLSACTKAANQPTGPSREPTGASQIAMQLYNQQPIWRNYTLATAPVFFHHEKALD
jgi:hypothetical protein